MTPFRGSRCGGVRTLHAVVAALLVAVLVPVGLAAPGAAPAAADGHCSGRHWVGSWAAAPAAISSPGDLGSPRPIADQTLRMVVTPTLSGRTARVRLSHRYGDEPVTFSSATVARRATGADAAPRTMRRLTFDGRRSVTVPAGGEVVSDRFRGGVRAGWDLLVSVHVSGIVVGPTEHFITNQTNYQAPTGAGDHSADRAGSAFAPVRTNWSNGWYFLSGLDVRAPRRAGAVVAFGDSITDGYQGSDVPQVENQDVLDDNARYPDFLDAVLEERLARSGRPDAGVLNAGISGNRVLRGAEAPYPFGVSALRRFRADALRAAGARDVVVLEGINDLGNDEDVRPAELIGAYRTLARRAHRAGLRVHLGTLTPAFGSEGGHGTAHTESRRRTVNRWIRKQRVADSVIDFDRAVRDPRDPRRLRPRYDSGDRLHPSSAGYRAMAEAVDTSALLRGGCR